MTFTVFENAVFHTLDPHNPTASALVSDEGRIRFLGSVGGAREFAPQARRIDLGGAHAMPGLADSHIHTAQFALRQAEVDLFPASSSSEAVALVAHRVGQLDPGDSTSWIFGGRWNHRAWDQTELPDRHELDAATGSHPTALHHLDLHTYWLNSAALAYLGIDAATPNPVGGTIVRDTSGSATGILLEAAGFNAGRALEEVTRDDLAKLLPSALRTLVRQGITSIHDIDGMDAWDAFSDLHERRELPLRVNKIMPVAVLDQIIEQGVRSGQGDPWLRRGGVKIFSDGSLSSGTCLMHSPYGYSRSEGLAVTAPQELNLLVKRANDNGLSAAVHAIGDRAVSNALDAFELAAEDRTSLPVASNRIEHVQHIARRDLSRLAASGALACMQPASCTSDIELVDSLLGDHDVLSYAWGSILAAGGAVSFSSDAPVEGTNPFHGLHAGTTRQRPNGFPAGGWQPEEILTRSQALHAAATSHTRATGEQHLKGTLETGKLADFIVVDRDPVSCPPLELHSTHTLMTVIDGRIHWSD
ncbi:amidohydrolase [Arthrobacter sp. AQ5-05]|uniref:amidohydrolase n=1 Tax=Arthrobacter sp. AQ5-05 TaxID=2184581 RepID=UPI000DCAF590|nr:amidohydrolase [Arthrobacter sp. AQ5-05]RAX49509.1 amidohydrolase [Arthrobacter sp. AQ5-05]